jgi:transposase
VRAHSDRSVPEIAKELGASDQWLHNWVRWAEIDRGARHALTSDEREELRRLRRENRRLAEEREILRKAAAFARESEDR